MNSPVWFKSRSYLHFDVPVGADYAAAITASVAARHSWSPLIKYVKEDRRYKALLNLTVKKLRPIMYSSHRDACILSAYSSALVAKLDVWYAKNGLWDAVVAYRPLGKSNYHFAERAQKFVQSKNSVTAICFDVTGFFDNLDHGLLKERLKGLLEVHSLSTDWYQVLKFITQYKYVNLDDLKSVPIVKARMKDRTHPLITIADLKFQGIKIHDNPNKFGIPQGTPISASLSNLYLADFDLMMVRETSKRNALYQRYSDDILVACDPTDGDYFENLVESGLMMEKLELQKAKTDRKTFSGKGLLSFQYLGFQLGHDSALIRPGSISRQWRTLRRSVRKAEKAGKKAMLAGSASQTYLRKLHVRYNAKGRNFGSYAERAGAELKSPAIKRQLRRLRRFLSSEMGRLKK